MLRKNDGFRFQEGGTREGRTADKRKNTISDRGTIYTCKLMWMLHE